MEEENNENDDPQLNEDPDPENPIPDSEIPNEEKNEELNEISPEENNIPIDNPNEIIPENEQIPPPIEEIPPPPPPDPFKESLLEDEIKKLIDIIFDKRIYEKQLQDQELDIVKKNILDFSEENISKGFDILNEILLNLRKQKINVKTFQNLSYSFYTIFPHKFSNKKILILDSESKVFSKMELIFTLLDIQNSLKMNEEEKKLKIKLEKERREKEKRDLEELEKQKKKIVQKNPKSKKEPEKEPEPPQPDPNAEINPEEQKEEEVIIIDEIQNFYDRNYSNLHCEILNLSAEYKEYNIIQSYIESTIQGIDRFYNCVIQGIFRLKKENELKFDLPDSNVNLLMYGCKISNLANTLWKGISLPNIKAPQYAFKLGKGIYFSDTASKSTNFCYPSPDDNIGFLLLCEVDLGIINEKIDRDFNGHCLPKGKRSVKGLGRISCKEETEIDFDSIRKEDDIIRKEKEEREAEEKRNLEANDNPENIEIHQNNNISNPVDNYHQDNNIEDERKYFVKVPIGNMEPTFNLKSSFLYNEYVIFDEKQVKLKYLVKLKFNYK